MIIIHCIFLFGLVIFFAMLLNLGVRAIIWLADARAVHASRIRALFAGCTISALLLLLSGCALSPVPRTTFQATIGGQKFTWSCPKQFTGTNIVCEVSSNGVARISVGGVSSQNDPAVVDKSYAGQAMVTKEFFSGVNQTLGTLGQLGLKAAAP